MSDNVKVLTEEELKKKATKEIKSLEKIEGKMNELQLVLADNPQFKQFMEFQANFKTKSAELFKKLEKQMIDAGVTKVEGDWGYLTIVNRTDYKLVDETAVPEEYKETQVVVNMKKVKEDIELTGEIPEGVEEKHSQYLRKGVKTLKELK